MDIVELENSETMPPHEVEILRAIIGLEDQMKQHPQAEMELIHHFSNGIYAREIHMPAGSLVIGKMHRHAHINNISQGVVKVGTAAEGFQEFRAPHQWISTVGTKRMVYVVEDCIWTTYHPTTKTNLYEIESDVIVPEDQIEQFLIDHSTKTLIGES